MQQQKFLEVFESLPTKRKQVLLGTLRGDAREKLMVDLGLSEAALTQHRRQLYRDFQIENFQNEADDPRSGERKLPQLIALCAKYKPDLVSPHPVLTAPPRLPTDVTWVERSELTAVLLPQLQQCRIVALTGITGIGKTALAERLVRLLPDGKPLKILNLDIGGIAAEFASSGAALLRALGEEPTLEDQKDAQNLLNHLLQLLRTHTYRVQIDSMERLLAGNDQEGWSDFCDPLWLDLFQQLLAGDCQSQIILTTQDVPGDLETIGSRYPQLWHCQLICGLSEEEQLQLFQKRGIVAVCDATVAAQHSNVTADNPNVTADNPNVTADNPNVEEQHGNVTTDNAIAEGQHRIVGADNAIAEGQHRIAGTHNDAEAVSLLKRIGKLYAGHPLVLRVIAEDLKTCGNDVKRYWQQGKFAEQEAQRPAQLSRRKLQLEVKQRVKDSIARLTETARQLLCRSAVFRRPVPEAFWLAMLPDSPHAQAALDLLKSRDLTAEDWEPGAWLGADEAIPLRQHNLIRAVAYELLKADPTQWETAERQAADLWLNSYEAAPNVPNLEKVRGYLEAFEHYCEVEDWENASEIYTRRIDFTQQAFHWQLLIWGYHKELIRVGSKLVGKLTSQTNRICFNQLGNAYGNLGTAKKSIEYYQKALTFSREISDRQGEGNALGNLGIAYNDLGSWARAIEFHQQHIVITCEIGDREGEGYALGNLGNVYHNLGNYAEAIEFHQKHLAIACEISDRQGESYALGNLGNAYHSLGSYAQAIEFHQKSLEIKREINNRQGEANSLGNLSLACSSLGNYAEATEYAQQHLNLAREIGERRGEGAGLRELGAVLTKLEQYSEALENLQNALVIFQQIGSRSDEAEVLKNLAELHQKLGTTETALEYCEQALAIATELGIPLAEDCRKLKVELGGETK
jgi:tetratricopeptide (TPR) repeat protein